MKTNIIITTCLLFSGLFSGIVKAQQPALAADQNPRYMESQRKYARVADTMLHSQGTTIQNTYKAYDWYESKLERRQQNREWRHQENRYDYNNYTPSWGYYGGYSPFLNFSYGNRWGRGGNWGGRNHFGFGW
jgi:hypothetical protein